MRILAAILCLSIVIVVPQSSFANPVKQKFEAATLAFSVGKYQEAIALYEETIKLYPNLAPAYFFMALAHQATGTPVADVLWLFEKTIEIDPTHAKAYEHLGKAKYSMGHFDDAEKYCLKAIEFDPQNVSAKLTLAWTYLLGQSRPEESIDLFEEVLQVNDTQYATLGIGMAYFFMDERPKVLEMITALRKKGQDDLALQLETMIRQGRSAPPRSFGVPMFSQPKPKSTLVREAPAQNMPTIQGNPTVEKMPVRLSGSLPRGKSAASNSTSAPKSSKERIQALRRRTQSYSKGSGSSH